MTRGTQSRVGLSLLGVMLASCNALLDFDGYREYPPEAGVGGSDSDGSAGTGNSGTGATGAGGSSAQGGSGGQGGSTGAQGGTAGSGAQGGSGGVGAQGGTGAQGGAGGTGAQGGSAGQGGAGGSGAQGGSAGQGGAGASGGTGAMGGSSGSGGAGAQGGSGGSGGATGGTGGSGGGAGVGPVGPSCAGGLDCGGVSCCESLFVPAGTFKMGRSETPGDPDYFAAGNADEVPEHNATVSGFYMDKFEVTVGRFRTWVEQYNGTAPPVGAGAHPAIPGSGWDASFDSELPANRSALELAVSDDCLVANDKWTSTVGPNENHAMNCANWYIAFAFCSWDGGRLPTEAERELVASGGEDRLYPWGGVIADATRANYNSGSPGGDVMAVGQFPAGNGRWGHSDLAGNVAEWALDYYGPGWYGGIGNSCVDCANIVSASYRVTRGGRYTAASFQLYTARRGAGTASNPNSGTGIRCAKSP